MSQSRWFWVLMGLVAVAAGASLTLLFSSGPPRTFGIGEPIRQDDFIYTVVGVARASAIGHGANELKARGRFNIVTVRVDNQALRVAFRWDPSMAHVVDAGGRTYEFSIDGQRTLDAANPRPAIVEHGNSGRFDVVFDLPAGIDHPALAFSNGIMMGDLFNGAAYLKARVPLGM